MRTAEWVKNVDWESKEFLRLVCDNMSSHNLPSVTQSLFRVQLSRWIMYLMGGIDRYIGYSADTRSSTGRYIGRVSVEYRSSIGRCIDRYSYRSIYLAVHRYFTDTWPILHRHVTDTSPILHRYFTDASPILYIGRYSTDTRPIGKCSSIGRYIYR